MKITEHFNKKIQLYSKQKRISLFLIGITFSLPGMANPMLKKMEKCWYTGIPAVIETKNCGDAICRGPVNCTLNGIVYSDLIATCIAKKTNSKLSDPFAGLRPYSYGPPDSPFAGLGSFHANSNSKYKCPNPMECAGIINVPVSFVDPVKVTLSRGYQQVNTGEVTDTDYLKMLNELPKGVFGAYPSPPSFPDSLKGGLLGAAIPSSTQSEEPEDAGSTQ